MEERRMNKRNEDIKIGVININIDKTDDFLIKPKGRGPKVDPFGFIDLTIKNFGFFPTYIESIDLLKINKKGEQEVFENIGIFGNNIIFPGIEIQGKLYIQAPNRINTNDEGSKLVYSFMFKEGVLRKKLELRFRYIGLKLQNGDIWYIPTFVDQTLSES